MNMRVNMSMKLIEGSRNSPLDDSSPASGLKVMDPEIQTLQEHGCRAPVSLAQKSFSWKAETMLSDRHSIPALNLQKYNLSSSPVIQHALNEYVENTGDRERVTGIPPLEVLRI